ncbi:MipA/OmpV family protein [Maricaulis sp.]|uniref:MipA/OmpV family protein n=1 Tax=Maricaulis sp. TaxID=1486257 RepID=UPI000C37E907|nr:MipA/OmpV family protein [Maricaulis sp.]MAC90681.1 hypothetical protein [Maricaulis sp.]
MNLHPGRNLFVVLGLALVPSVLLAPMASGQALAPVEARKEAALNTNGTGLSGMIGIGVDSGTAYAGSDTRESGAAPVLYGMYHDLFYLTPGEIGVYWPVNGSDWRIKAGLGYEPGRDPGDHAALANLNTIENTAVFAGGLYRQFGTSAIGVGFEADIGGEGKGVVTFIGGSYDWHLADNAWTLTAYGDISFADEEHLRTEFGITENEALASLADIDPQYRYTAYTPSAGLKSFGIGAGARYRFAENWILLGNVSGEFFGSEATSSPLVREDYEVEAFLGIAYTF